MPYIKQEDLEDDGRWFHHPELGRVRSGPRGNRYREVKWDRRTNTDHKSSSDTNVKHQSTLGYERHETEMLELRAEFARAQEARREAINEGSGVIGYGDAAYTDPRRAHKTRLHSKPVKAEPDSDGDSLTVIGGESERPSSISSKTSVKGSDPESGQNLPPENPAFPSPPNSPEPPHVVEIGMPPADCKCPIDLECRARGGHLIDCRRLVPLWKQWTERQQDYDPME